MPRVAADRFSSEISSSSRPSCNEMASHLSASVRALSACNSYWTVCHKVCIAVDGKCDVTESSRFQYRSSCSYSGYLFLGIDCNCDRLLSTNVILLLLNVDVIQGGQSYFRCIQIARLKIGHRYHYVCILIKFVNIEISEWNEKWHIYWDLHQPHPHPKSSRMCRGQCLAMT